MDTKFLKLQIPGSKKYLCQHNDQRPITLHRTANSLNSNAYENEIQDICNSLRAYERKKIYSADKRRLFLLRLIVLYLSVTV